MAGELHDVVAHGVSVIALQAGAALESLAAADPERTQARLAAIESTARDSAAELRRMFGVLREDDDAFEPTLRDIESLVGAVRAAAWSSRSTCARTSSSPLPGSSGRV
jgi:signal transduction histidine kinase